MFMIFHSALILASRLARIFTTILLYHRYEYYAIEYEKDFTNFEYFRNIMEYHQLKQENPW